MAMLANTYLRIISAGQKLSPGLALCASASLVANWLAYALGIPVMLIALSIGICFHNFAQAPRWTPGFQFASSRILKIGVALLGASVTVVDILELGAPVIFIVTGGILLTMVGGIMIGRLLGLRRMHAIITAGSVAICGVSAAMAISSVLPSDERSEQELLTTIVSVTLISTVAMIAYPQIIRLMGLSPHVAGIFFGASIHDVAQVAGAGFMVSKATASTAVTVKLMRVACLAPVVGLLGLVGSRNHNEGARTIFHHVPLFLVAFSAFVVVRSAHLISVHQADVLASVSRWCLTLAVVAIGQRTSLANLWKAGPRSMLALILQSAVLALFVIGVLLLLGTKDFTA